MSEPLASVAATNVGGLFEVTDGIYQVRNQDLSNMTIIEGNDGIIVVDPLVWSRMCERLETGPKASFAAGLGYEAFWPNFGHLSLSA